MYSISIEKPKPTPMNIDLWDTDRIGNDVIYHYVTPEMTEDQDAKQFKVTSDELKEFIEDNELNQFQTDVDRFSSYDAHDHLIDNWEEVKGQYWDDVVFPKLESSYKEAIAYVESYKAKHTAPLTDSEVRFVLKRVEANYGITLLKEAV
jgi:hypothetical protein